MVYLKSSTGRKLRKDSFEAQHDMDFVFSRLKELYVNKQLSTTQIPEVLKKENDITMSSVKCYHLIEQLGILRNKSEAVSLSLSSLDYSTTFLTDEMLSIIDGITLGDGGIQANENTKVARISISGAQKEFIEYCHKLLKPYGPSDLSFSPSNGRKNGLGTWRTCSKFHPDLYLAYQRWYCQGKKDVPSDVSMLPLSILLWYLGYGSLSIRSTNSMTLYFATNSFTRVAIKNNLITKLEHLGIQTSRITKDNRLFIKTESIVPLINYMGGESPVECYSYKFDIPSWRLNRTMKQTAKELGLSYDKLANWVKTGFVRYSRSPGGKKVLFDNDEFEELKNRLASGELSREKYRKATTRYYSGSNQKVWDSQIGRLECEGDEEYLDRMAHIYIENGFPYKRHTQDKLRKLWFGLRKSQYIIPNDNVIQYRRHGLSLADHFHQHIFSLNRKGKLSPVDLFNNSSKLKECLRRNKALSGTLTYAGLHSAICSDVCSPRLNNFPPLIARDIYNYYCKDGDWILDPCAGFSGRLIGASICKRKPCYLGIEPSQKTYYGLVDTQKFLASVKPEFKSRILNGCAEEELSRLRDESFDFCFTSPPYFNTEEYDTSKTQSHIRFSTYDKWKDGFLEVIIGEVHRILNRGKVFAINIGQFGKYDISQDIEKLALQFGFVILERKYIRFPLYGFSQGDKTYRLEPLLILQKK